MDNTRADRFVAEFTPDQTDPINRVLTRLVKLNDPEDDDIVGWLTALVSTIKDKGINEDEDESATDEACRNCMLLAIELRLLAHEARKILNAQVPSEASA